MIAASASGVVFLLLLVMVTGIMVVIVGCFACRSKGIRKTRVLKRQEDEEMGYCETFGNQNVEIQLNACENLTSTAVEYDCGVETNQSTTNEPVKVSQCRQLECTAKLHDGKIDADNSGKIETPTSMSMATESTASDQKLTFDMLMNVIYVDGKVQAVPGVINDNYVTGINDSNISSGKAETESDQTVCKKSNCGTEAVNSGEVFLQPHPAVPGHGEDRPSFHPTSSTVFGVTAL